MPEPLNERFQRLEPLIDRALELEDDARERFLAMCAEIHPDLIVDLRRALAPDDALLPQLGHLAAEVTREKPTDRRGLRAGAWRLLEKLGRGGMGTVYLAERADGAFDKRAAVKLLHGHDLRFKEQLERERRVLAKLDHPGIARLLDGGVLDNGQPYLVMELADGEDLDDWLARTRPNLHQRLQVFLAICEAVAYAHSVLIVHRDLKPSNIRVAGDGHVKLLDFGIAKLLAPDAERGSTQHLALTPDFAAPEQLRSGVISTRTDVYALGALLFLLLSGRPPHAAFDGNWAGFVERITGDDAARLSDTSASAALPVSLPSSVLGGDLDAIVAQALRREPMQRYANVDAFADDVRRYLDGRPVHARPPRLGYRAGKWIRRRWGVAASVGALSLAVIAGISGVVWQARYTAAERDAAQLEARRSQAVRDYLLLMFRDAGAQSTDNASLSARAVLDQAAAGIEREFASDPSTRQLVLATLGELYVYLGDFVGADRLLTRFQQLDDDSTPPALRAQVHSDLADVLMRRGEPQRACSEVEQALTLLRGETGDQRSATATALQVRGQCRRVSGQLDIAIEDYRNALALQTAARGPQARETAAAHNNLAAALVQAERFPEATTHLRAALAIYEAGGRGASVDAANTLNNLAVAATLSGDIAAAGDWFAKALDVRRNATGESAALGALQVNRGRVLTLLGRLDEARPAIDEAIALLHRYTGAASLDSASAQLVLADHLLARGDAKEAEAALQRAHAAFVAKLQGAHPYSLRAALALADVKARRGDATAITRLQAAIDGLRASGPAGAPYLAGGLCARAIAQRARDVTDALRDAQECLALRTTRLGSKHWETLQAAVLVQALQPASPARDAAFADALAALAATLGEASPRVLEARAWRR